MALSTAIKECTLPTLQPGPFSQPKLGRRHKEKKGGKDKKPHPTIDDAISYKQLTDISCEVLYEEVTLATSKPPSLTTSIEARWFTLRVF